MRGDWVDQRPTCKGVWGSRWLFGGGWANTLLCSTAAAAVEALQVVVPPKDHHLAGPHRNSSCATRGSVDPASVHLPALTANMCDGCLGCRWSLGVLGAGQGRHSDAQHSIRCCRDGVLDGGLGETTTHQAVTATASSACAACRCIYLLTQPYLCFL